MPPQKSLLQLVIENLFQPLKIQLVNGLYANCGMLHVSEQAIVALISFEQHVSKLTVDEHYVDVCMATYNLQNQCYVKSFIFYNFRMMRLISFCRFSQDFNPIHWDKTYARRTFFGEPVVHGAYAIQKCLALIQEEESFLKVIERLKVEFKKPIFL